MSGGRRPTRSWNGGTSTEHQEGCRRSTKSACSCNPDETCLPHSIPERLVDLGEVEMNYATLGDRWSPSRIPPARGSGLRLGKLFEKIHYADPGQQPAGAIVFLSYEGFGLITNAAEDMREPRRTLPRAILLSIGFTLIVYVAVAFTVLGTISVARLEEASEYALAAAAQPAFGKLGFTVMAIAALFSTASAINATLYGGANVSARLSERGGLPPVFRKRVWMGGSGSLLITGALVAAIGAVVDVERIAMAGSAAFLVVYGAVNLAHLRLTKETGASPFPLLLIALGCAGVLAVLIRHLYLDEHAALLGLGAMLVGCVIAEAAWRRFSGRHFERRSDEGRSASAPGQGDTQGP